MFHYSFQEFPMDHQAGAEELLKAFSQKLNLEASALVDFKIQRQSLDTRRANRPRWKYNVVFSSPKKISGRGILPHHSEKNQDFTGLPPRKLPDRKVAVVGSGPAGMFAALALAEKGYAVDVYEQGSLIKKRAGDVRRFIKQGVFLAESNIMNGEGGAGTFSDGKLTSRSQNQYTQRFFEIMIECGAPPEIAYLSRPHIGTDKLQFIITALREKSEKAGVRYFFDTKVENIKIAEGAVTGLTSSGGFQPYATVLFAGGSSARTLIQNLFHEGVLMQPKGFSVGVRIEHPQQLINHNQLGDKVDAKEIGAAEYYLTFKQETNRAYSFCMCPGGVVVPCADSEVGLCTNGMSYHNRATAFANSALVVPVEVEDYLPSEQRALFSEEIVFKGMQYQQALEEKAFALGGGEFTYPAQTARAFLEHRVDQELPKSSFQRPLRAVDLHQLFDQRVCDSLESSLRDFDHKIKGFVDQGLMIAPESRTSSAVRILRHPETFESVSTRGLLLAGEGAGYSGGIVSSAADGLRLADTIQVWGAA